MVQNGAKYNRALKQWQLPPGSNPTARMGVQGGEGEPDIKPLGQKKAALQKDAERKAKLEAEKKPRQGQPTELSMPKLGYSREVNWLQTMLKDKNFDAKKYIETRGAGAMESWKSAHYLLTEHQGKYSPSLIKKLKEVKRMARKLGNIDDIAEYYEKKLYEKQSDSQQ